MTPAQIQLLENLDKAALRLEAARKELNEATREHSRAASRASDAMPHIFRMPPPSSREDD